MVLKMPTSYQSMDSKQENSKARQAVSRLQVSHPITNPSYST